MGERATGQNDPNAPENRRALVTPSSLPKNESRKPEAITRGLLALASSGSLKRVRTSPRRWKAQVLRSCAPQRAASGRRRPGRRANIRLKGELEPYEQSFNAGEGLRAEIESAAEYWRMLKAAFSEHEKSVRAELERKALRELGAAIRAHEQGMSAAMQ